MFFRVLGSVFDFFPASWIPRVLFSRRNTVSFSISGLSIFVCVVRKFEKVMERAGHRKSKSASPIDGIAQILKNKASSRMSTDSHTCIDGSTRNNMSFVLELGRSSSKQINEKPIKKSMVQEMSKEVYSKRRTPSIIAKLMGLEGLPSPRHVPKQQNRLSESCQQRNILVNTQKNSSMEQLEFKDVYEDMEASHIVNRRCSSRWSSGSMLTKPEMVQIQQKLMDAKRSSADGKLQPLKELDDTVGMLYSNKPFSLKFDESPDSIFVKHLQDLKVHPSSSLHSHLTALKPLAHAKYGGNVKGLTSARKISTKHDTGSHLKREDGLLLDPHNRHRSHYSHKSSKTQLEVKCENKILPTRIVVLKPNLGNVQSSGTPIPSADNSYNYVPIFSNMKEHSNFGVDETMHCRKYSSYDGGLTNSMSKEARDKAREITRRMKDGCDGTIALMSSGLRVYTGDESSYYDFESDSDSESEVFKLLSRNSLDSNSKHPSYNFVDSIVDRETKKRLSERWKMSHRYQDAQTVCRESTLGEMLAQRDRETRPRYLNAKMGFGRVSSELINNNETSMLNGPLGISRRGDWKDKTNKTAARSRSLPPSVDRRKQQRITCRDSLNNDKILIHGGSLHDHKNLIDSGSMNRCRSKSVKENLSQKEGISSNYSKSKSRKLISCHGRSIKELDHSSTTRFEMQMEANVEDLSKQPMFQTVLNDETYTIPESDLTKTAESGNVILPKKHSELPPMQAPTVMVNCSACFDQESSFQELPKPLPEAGSPSLRCLGTELDSSESSKETDHLSPVSVLEIPYTEDTTSPTESFERVGVELRELRKQLQLLKMESGTIVEDEVVQQSPTGSERNYMVGADGWEASYILDMLVDSGFKEHDVDMFSTWHAPECPLDPGLFIILEKKYSNDITVPKHERKMLFDKINSELLQIFQQHIETCPWVMPKMVGLDPNVQEEKVRNALERLIWQEFADEGNSDQEMQLYSKIEIEKIGNEIGTMLVDDMIIEVICN